MERIKPVQIIGTQRSGSNLLRLMLNQIEGVYAPHPPHIINTFYHLMPGYGNLQDDDNFMTLIEDVHTLIELNPVPWESFFTDRETVFESCKNRSLVEVFRVIYELNAQNHNAHTWICKSMQNVKYLDYFESNGLKPKIIYLFRDGRDVALSFKKAIVGPKHIYSIAQKWKEEQELSMEVIQAKGDEGTLVLSYESLIHEPEKQLHKVCDFLNIDYSNRILDYYTSEESQRTADGGEMWANLRSPIIKGNANKFKREMAESEVKLFEQEAGGVLEKLGYQLMFANNNEVYHFSESDKRAIEKTNLQLQIDKRRKASKRDLRKRGAQDDFIKNLKKRLRIEVV